jgi:hypothetical protein
MYVSQTVTAIRVCESDCRSHSCVWVRLSQPFVRVSQAVTVICVLSQTITVNRVCGSDCHSYSCVWVRLSKLFVWVSQTVKVVRACESDYHSHSNVWVRLSQHNPDFTYEAINCSFMSVDCRSREHDLSESDSRVRRSSLTVDSDSRSRFDCRQLTVDTSELMAQIISSHLRIFALTHIRTYAYSHLRHRCNLDNQ